jgi:hypothetical protein
LVCSDLISTFVDLEECLASATLEGDEAVSAPTTSIDDLEASLIKNSTEVSQETENEYNRQA